MSGLYNPDDPKDISHPNHPNHWLYVQGEQGRAAQREREERIKLLATAKLSPEVPMAARQVLAGAAPTEQQSPEAFDRWAETYGNIVAQLKKTGSAKVPAGNGVNAKTLSEHLRAIRRAIKLFHYKSDLIDHTFDMEPYSFVAVSGWVYIQSRSNKARTEVLSAAPPPLEPLFVHTLEELFAVATVFSLKDQNDRNYALNTIMIYMPEGDHLAADLHRLFAGCRIVTEVGMFEITRPTVA